MLFSGSGVLIPRWAACQSNAPRTDHACRMLKFSSATIEEISEKLGFANRSHFSRVFQNQMGSGPASFRKS